MTKVGACRWSWLHKGVRVNSWMTTRNATSTTQSLPDRRSKRITPAQGVLAKYWTSQRYIGNEQTELRPGRRSWLRHSYACRAGPSGGNTSSTSEAACSASVSQLLLDSHHGGLQTITEYRNSGRVEQGLIQCIPKHGLNQVENVGCRQFSTYHWFVGKVHRSRIVPRNK